MQVSSLFSLVLILVLYSGCTSQTNTSTDTSENVAPISTPIFPDSITDISGNNYKTVTIGTQVWMAENLKTTKYSDGTDIPMIEDAGIWEDLTTPAYCWYNNDEAAYKDTYGALYNWHAVKTGKLCPTGWHVPNYDEWSVLMNYLGGKHIAGSKLKESGLVHWKAPNEDASNESGFTALPGGFRGYDADFIFMGENASFWSTAWYNTFDAKSSGMHYKFRKFHRFNYGKDFGLSVRCLCND